jgi:nucleoside-diphosphate-sugar epimerase
MNDFVVTGASGFIARELLKQLRESGYEALGVARREAGIGTVRVPDYAQTPPGRVLVHLAETADRGVVAREGADGERRSLALMDALLEKPFEHVVYGSSAALYGDAEAHPHGVDESVLVTDGYSRIKRGCELAVLRRGGCVARLVNVYGAGMHVASVTAAILAQVPGTGPLTLFCGSPVRDFLWVGDAAAGLASMSTARRSGVYNLGTGVGTSIAGLAQEVLALNGEAMRPLVETAPQVRDSRLIVDYSKTERDFGWRPRVALRDGLRRLLADRKPTEN